MRSGRSSRRRWRSNARVRRLDEIGQIAAKDLQDAIAAHCPRWRVAGVGAHNALSGHEKAQLKTLTAEARDLSELAAGYRGLHPHRGSAGRPDSRSPDGILVDVRTQGLP